MILENKGASFKITYDNKEFEIPEGKFEVEKTLGTHIIFTVGKPGWKEHKVIAISTTKEDAERPAIRSTEEVVEEVPVEDKAVVKEGVEEEAPAEEEK